MSTGPVERAVRRDLRKLDDVARVSGMAAAAVALAQRIDGTESASAAAAAARELRAHMVELLAVHERRRPAPEPDRSKEPATDELDEIRRRRTGGGE